MRAIDFSKQLNSHIQELDSLDYFTNHTVSVIENVGTDYMDIVYTRSGENIFYELLLNGSKRGKRYSEYCDLIKNSCDIETIPRRSPFDHFIVRFALSDEPKFAKISLIAFYQEEKIRILSPAKRDMLCKQIDIKPMPVIYHNQFSKSILENLLNTVMISKNKTGLLVYPDTSDNTYILIKSAKKLSQPNIQTLEELSNEYSKRFLDMNQIQSTFKASHVASLPFITQFVLHELEKPDFKVYIDRIEKEANYSEVDAKESLKQFLTDKLTKELA